MKTAAKKKKNYWQYLFLLGPFLVLMGLSAGAISGTWGSLPLGLLIAGIVLSGLWLLFQAYTNSWWKRRSTQAGANALVATLCVLLILGFVNFLATRYSVRVDLTEAGLYTLAPQSRELVENLSEPVKVWVFDREQNPQDRELLENYRRQGSEFSFEYVDPQARPGLAQQFGVKDFGEVYIEAGKQRQLVGTINEQERLSEVQLTNKLLQILSDRTAKVYFLQGHGERSISGQQGAISQAISALGNRNFTTEPLNLAQQPEVPQDASVLVVAGPKRELFDREVKALTQYVNRGGSLLLMLDPNTDPGLNSLLKNWGVTLDDRLIVDPQGEAVGLGPAVPLVTNYAQHPITQDFGNGISFYRGARPIESEPVAGVVATPILQTSPQSWAESDLENQNLQFNPESDRQGPLVLGLALSRRVEAKSNSQQQAKSSNNSQAPGAETQQPAEARLVVIGNSDFATDGLFEQQLNGDVFLNSVSWLSKQDRQLLSIRPKEAKNRRINLTPQQVSILWLTPLAIVPLIGFVGAITLWWLRR